MTNTNHTPTPAFTRDGFSSTVGFTAATKVRHNVEINSRYEESVRLAALSVSTHAALTARVAELEAALQLAEAGLHAAACVLSPIADDERSEGRGDDGMASGAMDCVHKAMTVARDALAKGQA